MERAGVELLKVVNEWRLSRIGVKVKLPGGELVKYSPDAFVRFRVPGKEEPYAIAVELDRGTEHLKDWARKADEMVAFASRDKKGRYPFQQLFAVDRLRYAVISAPGAIGAVDYRTRAGNLLTWTAHRLEQTGKEAWARNFFVRPFDARLCFPDPKGNPAQCTPAGLLRDPSWVVPGETEGRPLIGGRRERMSAKTEPAIVLGHHGPWWWRKPLVLRAGDISQHKHVIGLTGQGKSKLLASTYVQLLRQGIPAALIDPHSDLADDVLSMLNDVGYLSDPVAADKFLFVDFGRRYCYLPFNILKTRYSAHDTARHVVEVCGVCGRRWRMVPPPCLRTSCCSRA